MERVEKMLSCIDGLLSMRMGLGYFGFIFALNQRILITTKSKIKSLSRASISCPLRIILISY
jgi:hypothetical protein